MRIICSDAADVAHDLAHIADHVIMNLPHSADEFLDCALTIVKPGGIIHYYDIREEDDLFDGAEATIKDAASARDMTVRVLDRRIVRSYSPHQYNVVLDVEVCGGLNAEMDRTKILEVEPEDDEIEAIREGEKQFVTGEYVDWKTLKAGN